MKVKLVDFNQNYLAYSWNWLQDSELKKMISAPDITKKEQLKWYKDIKSKENYLIWGIEVDAKSIGACGLKNIGKIEGEYWGYIGVKSYWGKGIGKIIMSLIINKAKEIAKKQNIKVQVGCYVATTGPTFETPKEYQYFRIIGGDTVGMSTVPEVVVARQMGIPCFAISIITDLGVPGKIVEVTHEEVQKVAAKAETKMTLIMKELISLL